MAARVRPRRGAHRDPPVSHRMGLCQFPLPGAPPGKVFHAGAGAWRHCPCLGDGEGSDDGVATVWLTDTTELAPAHRGLKARARTVSRSPRNVIQCTITTLHTKPKTAEYMQYTPINSLAKAGLRSLGLECRMTSPRGRTSLICLQDVEAYYQALKRLVVLVCAPTTVLPFPSRPWRF